MGDASADPLLQLQTKQLHHRLPSKKQQKALPLYQRFQLLRPRLHLLKKWLRLRTMLQL